MSNKVYLRDFNLTELSKFLKTLAAPSYQTSQIMDWLHKKHAMTFSEMTNLGKKQQELLSEHSLVSTLKLKEAPESKQHKTRKYLMETCDGHLLESVLIVHEDRRTVCVSTQLGCRMRCVFCASGKGKFVRNLSAGEIVEQVSQIARTLLLEVGNGPASPAGGRDRSLQPTITNVVFMGMGEPLDNYEATMKAVDILIAEWGFGLGGRRVTVSTCGITPMIEKFVNDSRGRVRLSVSLHSIDDETRNVLVPINRKYPLKELIETLGKIHRDLKREITFEYTIIANVNDSEKDASGLAKLAYQLNAKVNLIPYNPIREIDYQAPSPEKIEWFRNALETKDVRVTLRKTVGSDIDAACGQLRLDRMVIG